MKKVLLISLIAGSFLFATEHNILTNEGGKNVENAITKAIQTEKDRIKNGNNLIKRNSIRKEIITVIKNMGEALFDLKKEDKLAAKNKIKYAINTLDKIKEKIIPIDSRLFVLEFKGSIKGAKKMISNVEKMIKEKNYQGAGEILMLLKDEMDIMEIDVNKEALKQRLEDILKKVEDNKLNEAFKEIALSFRDPRIFIRAVGKYPIGVVKAAYLIQQAHILNNSNTNQYKNIENFIKEAKAELKLDNILGYFYSKPLQKKYEKLMKILDSLEESAVAKRMSNNYSKAENAINQIKNDSMKTSKNPRYQIVETNK